MEKAKVEQTGTKKLALKVRKLEKLETTAVRDAVGG
ncbi:hypothetical protein GA0070609_3966 [Micromonospora echinaurantiaca]|uniref:Uncharacterized protein n=1 Tax=Micromonospora echinaurantiaca TaxID=47857 RepID=A0A1C5J1N8_9ACTN|nr:hypothetical protein GA0070609_3966 [Micromonospora echinaurantiaca]